MRHEYKIIETGTSWGLGSLVTEAMAEGWELWGNPIVNYINEVIGLGYCQAVVRCAPSEHSDVGKVETALGEPAGYTVFAPETSDFQTRSTVESAESIFSDILCRCHEKVGDNKGCLVHNAAPVSGMIS